VSEETSTAASREYRVRIPSLLEIFWSKLANWFRLLVKWRKQGILRKALQQARQRRGLRLETLEPRVLLSADLTYGSLAGLEPLDLTLKFTEDSSGNDIVQLINNHLPSGLDVVAEHKVSDDPVIDVHITGTNLPLADKLLIDFGFNGHTQDSGDKPTITVHYDGGDEIVPADLSPLPADVLRIENSGGMYTLPGSTSTPARTSRSPATSRSRATSTSPWSASMPRSTRASSIWCMPMRSAPSTCRAATSSRTPST